MNSSKMQMLKESLKRDLKLKLSFISHLSTANFFYFATLTFAFAII